MRKLILLHGALGAKSHFDKLIPLLRSKYEVYAVPFEGHGGIDTKKEYSIQLFSENLIDFLDKHNFQRVDVFGYSMGGYVALNTAITDPDRINTIVTLGTKFNWSKETAEKEVRMLNPEKIEEKIPYYAKYLGQLHHPEDWRTVVKKTANMMLRLAEGEKLNPNDVKKIEQKVTIGWGALDKMVSKEESMEIAKLLANGNFIELLEVEHPIDKIDVRLVANYIINALN